jgi:hypothetical protein
MIYWSCSYFGLIKAYYWIEFVDSVSVNNEVKFNPVSLDRAKVEGRPMNYV